jgi:hypothetical protein
MIWKVETFLFVVSVKLVYIESACSLNNHHIHLVI